MLLIYVGKWPAGFEVIALKVVSFCFPCESEHVLEGQTLFSFQPPNPNCSRISLISLCWKPQVKMYSFDRTNDTDS